MKLYYSPGACSLSPHIVALEAGLKLTLEKTDIRTRKTASGQDYLAVNPKGYVPALQLDDGSVLTEGPAIVQFLADKVPTAQLIPAVGTLERYKVLEWLNFIGTEIHKSFSPLFNPANSEARKQEAKDLLARRFPLIVNQLAKTDFLTGSRFSVADAYLFTVLSWAGHVGVELPQAIKAYLGRVAQRPAVQQALKEEGLA